MDPLEPCHGVSEKKNVVFNPLEKPESFITIKKRTFFLHVCKKCCNFEVANNQCYNNVLHVQNYDKISKEPNLNSIFLFSDLEKPAEVPFTTPDLSSLSGLHLLKAANEHQGFIRRLSTHIPELASATIVTFREKAILAAISITELKTKIKVEFVRDHPIRDKMRAALFRVA